MSLLQISQACRGEGTLLRRVEGTCLTTAAYIRIEDPATTNHENRLVWAAKVKANRKAMAREMLAKTLENPTLAANPEGATDGDVQYVVNSLIDTFATGA